MKEITWYDENTGEILGYSKVSTLAGLNEVRKPGYKPGQQFVYGRYQRNEFYIHIGTTASPVMKIENPAQISGNSIIDLHPTSVVDCGELGVFSVDDGVFEFIIDTPGVYKMTVKSVPYFDKTFEVTV